MQILSQYRNTFQYYWWYRGIKFALCSIKVTRLGSNFLIMIGQNRSIQMLPTGNFGVLLYVTVLKKYRTKVRKTYSSLGTWINSNRDKWRWFFSEDTSKIYCHTSSTPSWKVYKHSNQNSMRAIMVWYVYFPIRMGKYCLCIYLYIFPYFPTA